MTNEHSIARLSNELKELNERVTKLEEDLKRKFEIKLEPQSEVERMANWNPLESYFRSIVEVESVQEMLDYNDSNTKSNTES